jgi:hypothetical protein
VPTGKTVGKDEEFQVPPIGVSPITGAPNAINWGGLNKFNVGSRQVIADVEADELINWLPQLSAFQQVPAPGAAIGTWPTPPIWMYTDILNGNLFTWALCTDGHIYQMSTTGTRTDLGSGFSVNANSCDIANWQGTQIMISDLAAQKIYSWNGSVLTTVFSSQPEAFIAVYSNRLWMANGLTITWTNANTNNSLAGDSGSYTITDGRCANAIIGMRDFNGSLYVFGSNWIKTIFGLQTQGSPAALTFSQPTLESQVSIINKWSIIEYGGSLFFANLDGFWQLNAVFPSKISAALDGFFQNLDPSSSFTGSYATIWNMPCILWAVKWNGDLNYTVFGFTLNQQWFRIIPATGSGAGVAKMISGSVSSAVTQNKPITYFTDGLSLFNLFGAPASSVTSTFNSKIWDFGSKISFDVFTNAAVQLVVFGPATVTISEVGSGGIVQGPASPAAPVALSYNPSTGGWVNNAFQHGQWVNNASTHGNWDGTASAFYVLSQAVVPFQDRNMGLNITVTSAKAVLQSIIISYRKSQATKG